MLSVLLLNIYMRIVFRQIFELFLNKRLALMWFVGAGVYTVPNDLDHWSEMFLKVFRALALFWSMLILIFT